MSRPLRQYAAGDDRTALPRSNNAETGGVESRVLQIHAVARRATVDGVGVDLTTAECSVLVHLMDHANRLVTRPELMTCVWGMPRHKGSNVVDVVVCRLRQKLGAQGRRIETVHGLGYRFRTTFASCGPQENP